MLTPLLALLVSQAAPTPWPSQVADDSVEGERTLAATITPLPPPGGLRIAFYPSWGAPHQLDVPAGSPDPVTGSELGKEIDAGPAGLVVLTFDTRVPFEVGRASVQAAINRGLLPELRFAGQTNLKGQPMPEVLGLVKLIPAAPALTRKQIRGVLQGAYGEVRACYQKQLEANALEGRLVVAFNVVPDGSVVDATVRTSQLSAPEVERCVVQVVQGLKFPRLRGVPLLALSWPFRFQKGADKPPPPPIRR